MVLASGKFLTAQGVQDGIFLSPEFVFCRFEIITISRIQIWNEWMSNHSFFLQLKIWSTITQYTNIKILYNCLNVNIKYIIFQKNWSLICWSSRSNPKFFFHLYIWFHILSDYNLLIIKVRLISLKPVVLCTMYICINQLSLTSL